MVLAHVAMARVHAHERHQLGGHDHERAHHVVVFVLEHVTVALLVSSPESDGSPPSEGRGRITSGGTLTDANGRSCPPRDVASRAHATYVDRAFARVPEARRFGLEAAGFEDARPRGAPLHPVRPGTPV